MERKEITGMLDDVIKERGVPRNVRESLDTVIKTLNSRSRKESNKERISKAISILDESAGDPNIATYTRTQIWGIVSLLEGMKE